MSDLIFTNIQHIPRKKRGLTLNEYVVCDMVHNLSNSPKYPWCVKYREDMAKDLNVSKPTILSLIEKMIVMEFIEKDPKTKHLRSTQRRYDEFVIYGKESLPENDAPGKESLPDPVKKVYPPGKESLPYNNINNNIENSSIINNTADAEVLDVNTSGSNGIGNPPPTPSQYGNVDINVVIQRIKDACKKNNVIYGPHPKERMFAKHLLSKKFSTECLGQLDDMPLLEFIDNIILSNKGVKYGKVINSPMSIYYNRADNINKIRQSLNSTPGTTKEGKILS